MFWKGRNKFRDFELVDKKYGVERIICNPSQWFTEESVAKLFPYGTKLVAEDTVHRYGHISAYRASAWRGRGMQNIGNQTATSCAASGFRPATTMTAASSGAVSVALTLDGSYSATADEFENGVIAIFPSTWTGIVQGRVRSNTATSTTTTFTLKEGIVADCGASSTSKVHWNPYAYTGTPKTDSIVAFRSSIVGCLNVNGTADYYAWLQTWGPYLGQYGLEAQPGEGKYNRSVYFDTYGAFIQGGDNEHRQYAGFSLPCTADTDAVGSSGWSPLVMLQISP